MKSAGNSILLVDDDARTLRILAQMLREDGFVVECSCDGATALARLSRDPIPDVVITNFVLPHASGISVGRYARSRCASVRVLYLTEHPELVPPTEPEVMVKPVDYDDLTRRLRAAQPTKLAGAGSA